jgi:hypothetical protein
MQELEVGMLVRMNDGVTRCRVWKVTGIYLGSESTETLIGLSPVDMHPGSVHGNDVREMLVPRELTARLEIV